MPKILRLIALAAGAWIGSCHAQERWDDINFKTAKIGGFRLYGVSIFGGYTTLAVPTNGAGGQQYFAPGLDNLGSDTTYGSEWTAGWQRQRDNSTLSIRYTGTYNGQMRYSNLNSFGHGLNLGLSRKLHGHWTLHASANSEYRTMAQYLFAPTSLSSIAQSPATFDDLAAAFSIGQFSDTQVAAMLTGTPMIAPVGRGLLLGDRILTYGAQVSAAYAVSTRLNISFSSFAAGGQNALDNQQSYIVPRTLGANAGVALSYSLSPRTTFGLSLNETRADNQLQGSLGSNATASLGRKMGPHWFLELSGGMSYVKILKQVYGSAPSRQGTGGAALGYRTYAHSLVASYNRSSYDSYGLAAGLNVTASGAWSWHRPGSGWTMMSSFGRQQLRDTGFTSISGWMANAAISRALSSQISLRAEYSYFDSTGSYLASSLSRTVHSVRVSLGWGPQEFAR